jgi:hypothetical protein
MKTQSEIVEIIRAERNRWLANEEESTADMTADAVGALANVLAAIHGQDVSPMDHAQKPRPRVRGAKRRKAREL